MKTFRSLVTETMKDPQEAAAYLNASLEEYEQDGNLAAFLLAVKTVSDAQGGIAALAKKTNLNRQSLYRTLSKNGNPRLSTLETILHSLGFRITVEPF